MAASNDVFDRLIKGSKFESTFARLVRKVDNMAESIIEAMTTNADAIVAAIENMGADITTLQEMVAALQTQVSITPADLQPLADKLAAAATRANALKDIQPDAPAVP